MNEVGRTYFPPLLSLYSLQHTHKFLSAYQIVVEELEIDVGNTKREKVKFSSKHYFSCSQREQHLGSKNLYKTFTPREYSQFLNVLPYLQCYPHKYSTNSIQNSLSIF